MNRLILLALTCIFLVSHGEYCKIINDHTFFLACHSVPFNDGNDRLKILVLKISSNGSSPSGFFRDLSELEILFLSGRHFTNVSAIDFTGLENLKYLNLEESQISNLDGSSTLNILKNLKYFKLRRNDLRDIDSMAFSGLYNLIYLDLGRNKIDQVKSIPFSGLTNLRSLQLDFNLIHHIEDGAFNKLKNLKKLDLSGNRLTTLDQHTFKGLDNLRYFSLAGNYISTINIETFSALTKLIQLDLSRQDFDSGTLDLNAFPQFVDLQTKTVIYIEISSALDDLEQNELQWISTLGSKTSYYAFLGLFGKFPMKKYEEHQIDLNNLTLNIASDSLVLGNLDLSLNRITSIKF